MKKVLTWRMIKTGLISLVFAFIWMMFASLIAGDGKTSADRLAHIAVDAALFSIIGTYTVFFIGSWAKRARWLVAPLLYALLLYVGFHWYHYFMRAAAPVLADNFKPRYWPVVLSSYGWNGLVPFLIAMFPPYFVFAKEYLKENKIWREWFIEGKGGSGDFAGPASFDKKEIRLSGGFYTQSGLTSKHIIFGRGLWADDPRMKLVGDKTDAHMLTIGCNGSGKSVTAIYPNLCTYTGTVLVLDPKAEHTRQTMYYRSSSEWLERHGLKGKASKHLPGGKTYVLDPFNEARLRSWNNNIAWHYNPLSEIDPLNPRARELLAAISDGCVNPERGDSKHFEENTRYLIEGATAHVLTDYPADCYNLPFIYDLLSGIDSETGVAKTELFNKFLADMLMNDACGGLPQQAAMRLMDMGDRERGSVLSTSARSLKWCGDPAMRKQLIKSDFKFADIGTIQGVTQTVYIVLPDGMMAEQMRWLRTLSSVAITLLRNRTTLPELPTLFVLDEFARLGGQIKAISDGVSTLRSYKVKLWPCIQNLGQLKHDYPDRWNSFIANSTVQVFGVHDMETASWVSEMIGRRIVQRTEKVKKLFGSKKVVSESAREILTPAEVITKLGKTSNRQIVFPVQGLPLRLERMSYKPIKGFNSLGGLGLRGQYEF